MKLIAKSDFRNVPDLGLREEFPDGHIELGEELEIGSGNSFKELSNPDKQIVATLVYAGRVVYASDKEGVAAIKEEVAANAKRKEAVKKAEAVSNANALEQLLGLLMQAKAAAAK